MNAEDIKQVNRTDRTKGGAVGKSFIVLERVTNLIIERPHIQRVLDFGSGKTAPLAAILRAKFPQHIIDAYDIGKNHVPGVNKCNFKPGDYELVVASNVIQVQPSIEVLRETLCTIFAACYKHGGYALFNFSNTRLLTGWAKDIPSEQAARKAANMAEEFFTSVRGPHRVGVSGGWVVQCNCFSP